MLTIAILLTHFLRRKGELRIGAFRISGTLIGKVCKRGVPEAVTQLTTPVTVLCYNLMLARRLIGDIGVSCPGIQDGNNEKYELTKEGVQPSHRNVDRAAIAQCMADMIVDESHVLRKFFHESTCNIPRNML